MIAFLILYGIIGAVLSYVAHSNMENEIRITSLVHALFLLVGAICWPYLALILYADYSIDKHDKN